MKMFEIEKPKAWYSSPWFIITIIVIVIAAVVGGYYFLMEKGVGVGEIPQYQGATPSDIDIENLMAQVGQTFPAGVDVSIFYTTASPSDVINWYRTEMSARGLIKIIDNLSSDFGFLAYEKGDKGAIIVALGNQTTALILASGSKGPTYQVVAVAIYYLMSAEGYPAIAVSAALSGDNEIRINVSTGSIPANEWAYSVSSTEGTYFWTTGTSELTSPYVSLGTYASGTYYVSLKHVDSGHLYFSDRPITTS